MREAIRAARKEFSVCTGPANSTATFQMDVPATMPVVKELCGLDAVERYLESRERVRCRRKHYESIVQQARLIELWYCICIRVPPNSVNHKEFTIFS
jgi:hypothetical protein